MGSPTNCARPPVQPAVNTPVPTTIVPILVLELVHEIGAVPPYGVKVKVSPVSTVDDVGNILNVEVEGPNGVPSSSAPWMTPEVLYASMCHVTWCSLSIPRRQCLGLAPLRVRCGVWGVGCGV